MLVPIELIQFVFQFFSFLKIINLLRCNKTFTLMENHPHMISDAGRRYQKLRTIRPLNTPDRLRMYHSIQVQPQIRKSPEKKPTMDTIDREKKHTHFYRYNKQMTINTNYNINQSLIYPASRRQSFQKGQFTRIIGDIRDQDYSLPLLEDSDRRCAQAFITLPHQSSIITPNDTHNIRAKHHHINFQKQLSRDHNNLSEQIKKVNSLVSTQQSQGLLNVSQPIKKRSKRIKNLQLHDALKKIRYFDHDIGHKYGDQLYIPKKVPQYYDIANSNESVIKKSMSTPKGYVEFGTYKQKIANRLDRSDPYWGMTVNYEHTHENPEWNLAKTLKMQKVSERRMNQVYSKYPLRQNMQLIVPKNFSPEKSQK